MNELQQYWNNSYTTLDIKLKYDDWLDKYEAILKKSAEFPILDLGCGVGNNTLYLIERNYQVFSCDISSAALAKLKQHIPQAEIKQFDMSEGLPFADSAFSIIVADLSLHYFSEEITKRIIKDIHRVLKVNGTLFCRVNSTKELINNYNGQDSNKYYTETDGIRRRFFDEGQIPYYLDKEAWQYIAIEEKEMKRYSKPKTLWEIAVMKKDI